MWFFFTMFASWVNGLSSDKEGMAKAQMASCALGTLTKDNTNGF